VYNIPKPYSGKVIFHSANTTRIGIIGTSFERARIIDFSDIIIIVYKFVRELKPYILYYIMRIRGKSQVHKHIRYTGFCAASKDYYLNKTIIRH